MANTTAKPETPPADRMTMDRMHAKPKDHLWVLILIAACALTAVWGSWLEIGNKSGFAPLGPLSTGWTPAVIVEAYWGYTLFAWLAGAPGRRSKRFAMWSFFAMFTLSLIGQASSHLTAHAAPPAAVRVFIGVLPVVVVACVAVLVHLRQLDRADAVQAEEAARKAERIAAAEAAAADERTVLRAQLDAARAALEPVQADLETARGELGRVTAKADSLEQKLAALKPKRTRTKAPNAGRRRAPNSAPQGAPNSAGETTVPRDLNVRTQALGLYLANPNISGKELGESVGRGERWGQLRKNEFDAAAPADPQARSEQ